MATPRPLIPAPALGSLTAAYQVPLPPPPAQPSSSAESAAPPRGRANPGPAPHACPPPGRRGRRPLASFPAGPFRTLQPPGAPSRPSRFPLSRPGPRDTSPRTPTPPLLGSARDAPAPPPAPLPHPTTSGLTLLSNNSFSSPFPGSECPPTSPPPSPYFSPWASAVPNSWEPCLFRTPDSPSVPCPRPLFSLPFQAAFSSRPSQKLQCITFLLPQPDLQVFAEHLLSLEILMERSPRINARPC